MIPVLGLNPDKFMGGKSLASPNRGQSTSVSRQATIAQPLANITTDKACATLWEMQTPIAIPPHLKILTWIARMMSTISSSA